MRRQSEDSVFNFMLDQMLVGFIDESSRNGILLGKRDSDTDRDSNKTDPEGDLNILKTYIYFEQSLEKSLDVASASTDTIVLVNDFGRHRTCLE